MAKEAIVKEEKIEIPDIQTEKIPEGYTEDEWNDLSLTEREGILLDRDKVNAEEEEVEEKTEEITTEQLKELAEGEPPAEVVKEKPGVKEEVVIITDEDLLSYRPVVDESKLKVDFKFESPAEFQTEIIDLKTKYDAGDITRDQYDDARDEIKQKISDYRTEALIAARAELREKAIWELEYSKFYEAHPEYVGDTADAKMMRASLNVVLSDIDSAGMSGMALLVKANKVVAAKFGVRPPEKKEEIPVKKEEGQEKPKPADKPKAKIPDDVTLADIPAAGMNETDNWMKALDRLSGEEQEAALARLTKAQREAYRMAAK